MTLSEYNEIIVKLQNCVNTYERMTLGYNKFQLYLANGDIINVKSLPNNIPHLLGVNLEYLKQSNKFKNDMNSFEMLKYFLDEHYAFSKMVSEGKLSFDLMFSKYIKEKLEAFTTNINIRTDDIHFVLKYDDEKTYKTIEITDVSDYYIVRRQGNNYFVLGIVKNDKTINGYMPTTSRKYDYYSFNKFISEIAKKQEITYPYLMKVENIENGYNGSFSTNVDNKINILNNVIKASENYDATPSTVKDFLYSLNKSKNNNDITTNNINVLRLLSDNLKEGNVLDTNTILEIVGEVEIRDDIKTLIDVCNNLVCNNLGSETALENYSDLSNENTNLKEQLKNQKEELEKLKEENNKLNNDNEELTNELNSSNEKLEILDNAFKLAFKIENIN